jgi:hypothetical protein
MMLDYRRLISGKVEVRVDRLDILRLLEIRIGSWFENRLSSRLDIRLVIRVVVIFRFDVRVDTRLDIRISRRLEISIGLRFLNRLNRRFFSSILLQKVRHKSYLLCHPDRRLFLRNRLR